jgi:hypothetical protein
MPLESVMTCLIAQKSQILIFQLSFNILWAKILIYSIFIEKRRSSHYFIQIIQNIFHNKRMPSHFCIQIIQNIFIIKESHHIFFIQIIQRLCYCVVLHTSFSLVLWYVQQARVHTTDYSGQKPALLEWPWSYWCPWGALVSWCSCALFQEYRKATPAKRQLSAIQESNFIWN